MRRGSLVRVGRLGMAALLAWAVPSALEAQLDRTPGRVVGRIVDQVSGLDLSAATLEVLGTEISGPASPDGRFMLPLMAPGTIEVRLVHPGYRPRVERLEIREGRTTRVRIGLVQDSTYPLKPLVVEVRSRVLEQRGFYERQRQGYSAVFLTQQDIRARDPQNVTELFADVPGAMLIRGGLDGPQLVFGRATSVRDSGVCRPALYLDGVKSQIRLYDMILDPTHLEGVEIYVGASGAGQFSDPCGAVLIWTP